MAAFDEGGVYYSYQGLERQEEGNEYDDKLTHTQAPRILALLREFLETYSSSENGSDSYIYRDALVQNASAAGPKGTVKLLVDLQHVIAANSRLKEVIEDNPTIALPLFEQAASEVLLNCYSKDANREQQDARQVQILLHSSLSLDHDCSIRNLSSERVGKLITINGIITAASKPKHKATHLVIQCKTCKATQAVALKPGLGGALLPRICTLSRDAPNPQNCGYDPFQCLPDRSKYVDQQTLKLQEKPEDVPTGEMPRSVLLVADRGLVNRVSPGTRVTITGIFSTFKGKSMQKGGTTLQQPYIRVVSMIEESGDTRSSFNFSNEEIAQFKEFASRENVLAEVESRIAPNIHAAGADSAVSCIKRAVACLLFGGARKRMPDGTNRRGDINVLLLGDPSTAKSQFLKFASKAAPIAVYTSGKGSSAAGLTATVVQDASSREFYLEGGAMVLADNGVVCIDEFDKMRPEDRVAIHEAMEQQTISIAKAGITTVLKARTSVLAAANPPSGRYDDLKSAEENIDLQSTILSRFDLIFLVRDVQSVDHDRAIARLVLDNHRLAASKAEDKEEQQQVEFLRRYIHYCRSQCSPRLSEAAMATLVSMYVDMRQQALRRSLGTDGEESSPVPITVRQLEALIRISEALARMCLQTVATEQHAATAVELFTRSTLDTVKSGMTRNVSLSADQLGDATRILEKVRRRVHIGAYITVRVLMDELVGLGESEWLVQRVLLANCREGSDFQMQHERKVLKRLR